MGHSRQTSHDISNDGGLLQKANPIITQRGRRSSHLGKQNHQQHFSFHQISRKQGNGQPVLGQQEEELMAKQALQQRWLGALRLGTEKQTRHVQNLEIQTELGLLWHQSASRDIWEHHCLTRDVLIAADRKRQLIFFFVQTRTEPNCGTMAGERWHHGPGTSILDTQVHTDEGRQTLCRHGSDVPWYESSGTESR